MQMLYEEAKRIGHHTIWSCLDRSFEQRRNKWKMAPSWWECMVHHCQIKGHMTREMITSWLLSLVFSPSVPHRTNKNDWIVLIMLTCIYAQNPAWYKLIGYAEASTIIGHSITDSARQSSLKVLPFPQNGIFDSVHILSWYPVHPVPRCFCRPKLNALRQAENGSVMEMFGSPSMTIPHGIKWRTGQELHILNYSGDLYW